MRGYVERLNIFSAAVLNTGGNANTFTKEFPMGEGWFAMYITVNIALTVGTGTTPITEGELMFIKNVLLRTDRGEIICNLPGRAIWKIAALKNEALPYKDAIAAATATYRVHLPIYFADWQMRRPEDTILNTARYNSISLQITLGTVADLLGTPGTATIACTADLEIERSFGVLPKKAEPVAHVNYDFRPPVDASVTQNVDIERSAEMSLKRIYTHTGTSGTGGAPWSGQNGDAIISTLTIRDQNRFIEKDRLWRQIQQMNKLDSALETLLSGVVQFNFVRDRSTSAALATADKATLMHSWVNGTAPANSIVTVTQEAIRKLKPAA